MRRQMIRYFFFLVPLLLLALTTSDSIGNTQVKTAETSLTLPSYSSEACKASNEQCVFDAECCSGYCIFGSKCL